MTMTLAAPAMTHVQEQSTVIRFAIGKCSLGCVLIGLSDRGICAITLGDDADTLARHMQDRFPDAECTVNDQKLEHMVDAVIALVENPQAGLDVPLDVQGTVFQKQVWALLAQIPCGQTATYAEIAERIGRPKASRAVAQACGANKIAVAIPCHRVIHSDGTLSGYRWGVERKAALLEREQRNQEISV